MRACPRVGQAVDFAQTQNQYILHTCDQLEGPRGDLLAGGGHADHHRLAPALVAALQGLPHDAHVADALEGVVHPSDALFRGHFDDHVLHARNSGSGYLGAVQAIILVSKPLLPRNLEMP